MESIVSPTAKLGTYAQPRALTQSEIVSLRQDAISTSQAMKGLMAERRKRQRRSILRLLEIGLPIAAE